MPPRKSSSPVSVRKSPRKSIGQAPARLGMSDDWGAGSAGKWTSDLSVKAAEKTAAAEEKTGGAPIVGLGDVLTLMFGFGLFAYEYMQLKFDTLEKLTPSITMTPYTAAAIAGTALMIAGSHLIYAFIWYYPKKFKAMSKKMPLKFLGKHPVAVFGQLVLMWKMVQQAALLAYLTDCSWPDAKSMLLYAFKEGPMGMDTKWVIAFVLLAVGQLLNLAIYKAIGKDGVYYGFKLGRPVPWSTAFPFNAKYRHPQYVGAMLSQLGVLLVLTSEETLKKGLAGFLLWWIVLYTVTSIIEAKGDNDK